MDSRSEAFEACLARLAAGASVDDVLRSGECEDVAADVRLAACLLRAAPRAPRPAFRAGLQVRVQETVAVRSAPRGSRWRARLLPRLAGLGLAVAMLCASVVVASADSLPGQPLYPVKLATERTQLLIAGDPASLSLLHLELAGRRLDEIHALVESGTYLPGSVVDAWARSHASALAAARDAGDPALVRRAQDRAEEHRLALAALAAGSRPEVRELLEPWSVTSSPPIPRAPGGMVPTAPPPLVAPREGERPIAGADDVSPTAAPGVAGPRATRPAATPTGEGREAYAVTVVPEDAPARPGASDTEAAPPPTAPPPTSVPPSAEPSRPPGTAASRPGERERDLTSQPPPSPTPTPWWWWPRPTARPTHGSGGSGSPTPPLPP